MGNQAGIIIRNVKNELFHSANRLILNEVKGIECLLPTQVRLRTHFLKFTVNSPKFTFPKTVRLRTLIMI